MIKELKVKDIKSFTDATIPMRNFTVLLGTNASGKSNVRDIMRFLHGLSRGYKLVELFAGKYEGSDKIWGGIRGGPNEFIRSGAKTCDLDVSFSDNLLRYHIALQDVRGKPIRVYDEWLINDATTQYSSRNNGHERPNMKAQVIRIWLTPGGDYRKGQTEDLLSDEPVLTQVDDYLSQRDDQAGRNIRDGVKGLTAAFSSMRFLDLSPSSMREPTYPGRLPLGDAGENLSTVLQYLVESDNRGRDIISWLKVLTPMDVADLAFEKDARGRVSLVLVEHNKRRTSAESASDGTLRFLAYLALAFSTDTPTTCFVEEIDNGIHPSRLQLLVELIETQAKRGALQVVASTHSPALMNLLSRETLMGALLVYRTEDSPASNVKLLQDIPGFDTIINRRLPGALMEASWFENTVEALEYREDEAR